MISKSLADEPCYQCGERADTRDHAVPLGLFPPPRPSNLITVPACRQCNEALSRDEEFFRIFVMATSYEHPAARELWDQRVMQRLPNQPRFRAALVSKIRPVDVRSPVGLHLGRAEAILVEKPRIDAVLEKMVRGLYLHHEGSALGDVNFETFLNPSTIFPEAFRLAIGAELGEGVIRYWRAVASDDPRASIWWFVLYEHVLFMVITEPQRMSQRGNP